MSPPSLTTERREDTLDTHILTTITLSQKGTNKQNHQITIIVNNNNGVTMGINNNQPDPHTHTKKTYMVAGMKRWWW